MCVRACVCVRVCARLTTQLARNGLQVADAIRRNTVLGSPAIGALAAMGLAMGATQIDEVVFKEVRSSLKYSLHRGLMM